MKIVNSANDFGSLYLQNVLRMAYQKDIVYSDITNWYVESYPFYRLNFYNNVQVSQVLGIYTVLNPDFLNQFSNIVEIGTYNGGLTSWLFDNKSENANVVSYDIDGSINTTKRTDIDFRVEDCFSDKTFSDIISFINQPGKTLVLCDGGDKPKEFNEFSKYLKSGDVIMAHDYCEDKELWDTATKFWQWPYAIDTKYESIKDAIETNQLIPYKNKEFNFFLWASYMKQ